MSDTLLILRSPGDPAAKTWAKTGRGTDDTRCTDYSLPAGPFAYAYAEIRTLADLADLLVRCPIDAFHVRGKVTSAFVSSSTVPYRRTKTRGLDVPSLEAMSHQVIPVDYDGTSDAPMGDLRTAAEKVRSLLPDPFRSAECVVQATSSAGMRPGIRLRLWFLNEHTLTDEQCRTWFDGISDTSIYQPHQPIYIAAPRFIGLPDPYPERIIILPGTPCSVPPPEVYLPHLSAKGLTRTLDARRNLLSDPKIPEGARNTELTRMAGRLRRVGHTEPEILALLRQTNLDRCSPPLPDTDLESITRSVASYAPTAAPLPPPKSVKRATNALKRAAKRLADDPALLPAIAAELKEHIASGAITITEAGAHFARAFQRTDVIHPITREQITEAIEAAAPQPTPDRALWQSHLRQSDTGGFIPDEENLRRLLEHHPDIELWHDTRADRPTWSKCPWDSAVPRPVSDHDDYRLRCWLCTEVGWSKCPGDARTALLHSARQTPYDPWVGYLEGLTWDGTERLSGAASVLLGADTPVEAAQFRMWMISAVARSLAPGCQAENVIVLEGAQGTGKTSFLKELCGQARFYGRLTTAKPDVANPRVASVLRGPVIIEMPEISTIRSADTEELKAFLDQTVDTWTPLYGKSRRDDPRAYVFAGTTNHSTYLRDTTGNRRFWPIRTGTIRLDLLRTHRDALWAEAVHLYRSGAQWYPTRAEEAPLAAHVETRRQAHPIEERIEQELDQVRRPEQAYANGLRYEIWQLDYAGRPVRLTRENIRAIGGEDYPRHDAALAEILRHMGLERKNTRFAGATHRYYEVPNAAERGEYRTRPLSS